jgi:multicomponent Na+:H+ antiporter subunit D
MPGILRGAQEAAVRMADAAGYQAIVLDHAWLPVNVPPVEQVFRLSSVLRGIVAALLALALAGLSLSPYWPRKKPVFKAVKVSVMALRSIHSGHVGDYVALLTFGVAAFGVALSVLIKLGF